MRRKTEIKELEATVKKLREELFYMSAEREGSRIKEGMAIEAARKSRKEADEWKYKFYTLLAAMERLK